MTEHGVPQAARDARSAKAREDEEQAKKALTKERKRERERKAVAAKKKQGGGNPLEFLSNVVFLGGVGLAAKVINDDKESKD